MTTPDFRRRVGPIWGLIGEAMDVKLNQEEVSLIGRCAPVPAQGLYDQYIQDWNDCPDADGAPFRDLNGNAACEPSIDIPGNPGADWTLYYVANDCNPFLVGRLTGSLVIGLEIRRTIWGYNREDFFGNSIFVAAKIINTSGAPVESICRRAYKISGGRLQSFE
jgi:hypothetical protein